MLRLNSSFERDWIQRRDHFTSDFTMKAFLTALLLAAFVATIVADVEEFSEEALNRLHTQLVLVDNESEAELINGNTRIQFTLRDEPQPEGMLMKTTAILERAPPESINVCGHWIGLKLDKGREYFCNITNLGVELDYGLVSEGVHNMQFILPFESDSTRHGLLDIPIMRFPSAVNSGNLMTWARENRVGIISPVSVEQLTEFHVSQKLTLNFTWLRELLRFGVKKSRLSRENRQQQEVLVYVPRPLVLSDDVINKLWEELEWFKYDEGSEDTDELSDLAGLADLNARRRD